MDVFSDLRLSISCLIAVDDCYKSILAIRHCLCRLLRSALGGKIRFFARRKISNANRELSFTPNGSHLKMMRRSEWAVNKKVDRPVAYDTTMCTGKSIVFADILVAKMWNRCDNRISTTPCTADSI